MKSGKKSKPTLGSSSPSWARLLEVCALLNFEKAKYVIVGGQALNLHGIIRGTKDIDVLIPKDRENTARILSALSKMGFGIAKELDVDEVLGKPWTIIGDTPRVDLMTVANRVKYEEAAKTALRTSIDGVVIPYVDHDNLIKSKETGRLQDQADIERLKAIYQIK